MATTLYWHLNGLSWHLNFYFKMLIITLCKFLQDVFLNSSQKCASDFFPTKLWELLSWLIHQWARNRVLTANFKAPRFHFMSALEESQKDAKSKIRHWGQRFLPKWQQGRHQSLSVRRHGATCPWNSDPSFSFVFSIHDQFLCHLLFKQGIVYMKDVATFPFIKMTSSCWLYLRTCLIKIKSCILRKK